MSNLESEVSVVLGACTDDKSVIAEALLDILDQAETDDEKSNLIAYTIQNRDTAPRGEQVPVQEGIPKNVWDVMVQTHTEMVRGFLRLSFARSRRVADFSHDVLRMLRLFDSRVEQIFVLAAVLYSDYVPYAEVLQGPLTLAPDQYIDLLKNNNEMAEKIRFVVRVPFMTHLDGADLVLRILDDCSDTNLRVALLALYAGVVGEQARTRLQERQPG